MPDNLRFFAPRSAGACGLLAIGYCWRGGCLQRERFALGVRFDAPTSRLALERNARCARLAGPMAR